MSANQVRLRELCLAGLPGGSPRLEEELREIAAQNEEPYLLDLHDRKVRYPENPNNLLVAQLLGIVEGYRPDQPPEYVMGEWPDIDIDFLGPVRDYLRQVWAAKEFGEENVCAIGNYTTFGLKSSFLDMARVHGLDSKEINVITKTLDMKDGEGKLLTYEKAMEEYPDLREYCEHHPEVRDSVRRIVNRNRGMGTHAGGLVISSKRLDEFVPLVRGKEGAITSAWSEGLHGQDLGPMGLNKFDLLGITDLMRIALGCKLVKERLGLAHVCAHPEVNHDWSDTAYLEDPEAIAMANEGDLLGIFQFDSPGIRKLAKGNVRCFDDLVAFSALYRPGPLNLKMHEVYVNRMHGRDQEYLDEEHHPILDKILGRTFGVMAYQEQVMQILHAVGEIPLKDCEAVRKAISKKKVELFIKYKEQFVEVGQRILGQPRAALEHLWSQVEAFSGYGFNKSHSVAYTYISSRLLYLKAHYPLEFFNATLSCEKTIDKIREYKRDAMAFRRKIGVVPIDINRSRRDFAIGDDGKIYYGLADLKGIGDESAQRIMDGQPYANLQDFLARFGTDAKVVTVLIELGCFGMDRERKLKFYEHFKEFYRKQEQRQKRFAESTVKFQYKLIQALRPVGVPAVGPWVTEQWQDDDGMEYFDIDLPWNDMARVEADVATMVAQAPPEIRKEAEKALKAYQRCLEQNAKKVAGDEYPDLREFGLGDIEKSDDAYTDRERAILLSGAEITHYGFRWIHPIELSANRLEGDWTFEAMRRSGADEFPVEVLVRSVTRKLNKKATEQREKGRLALAEAILPEIADLRGEDIRAIEHAVLAAARGIPPEAREERIGPPMKRYRTLLEDNSGYFYSLSVEDANSEVNTLNVWGIDWERFHDTLSLWVDPETGEQTGNIVRMRMVPPNGGFPTYSLKSWKKYEYARMAPSNKENDFRVQLMEDARTWKNW